VSEILVRTFPVRLALAAEANTDGRIIEGRCVPYGVAAMVRDPGTDPYREVFLPGAFRGATKAPDRIHFKFNHGSGLGDWIGRGLDFVESDDGLDGSFRVVPGAIGDHALAVVDDGIMSGLSVGFEPLGRDRLDASGAVVRSRCRLVEVSLCPEPAFVGAAVTGRRSRPDGVEAPPAAWDEAPEVAANRAAIDARLRAIGLTIR